MFPILFAPKDPAVLGTIRGGTHAVCGLQMPTAGHYENLGWGIWPGPDDWRMRYDALVLSYKDVVFREARDRLAYTLAAKEGLDTTYGVAWVPGRTVLQEWFLLAYGRAASGVDRFDCDATVCKATYAKAPCAPEPRMWVVPAFASAPELRPELLALWALGAAAAARDLGDLITDLEHPTVRGKVAP